MVARKPQQRLYLNFLVYSTAVCRVKKLSQTPLFASYLALGNRFTL
jgi:hypothetical protein